MVGINFQLFGFLPVRSCNSKNSLSSLNEFNAFHTNCKAQLSNFKVFNDHKMKMLFGLNTSFQHKLFLRYLMVTDVLMENV